MTHHCLNSTQWMTHLCRKARNVLLKAEGKGGRGIVAKVADFGLSVRIDTHATHVSEFQVCGAIWFVVVCVRSCPAQGTGAAAVKQGRTFDSALCRVGWLGCFTVSPLNKAPYRADRLLTTRIPGKLTHLLFHLPLLHTGHPHLRKSITPPKKQLPGHRQPHGP
jgi:hypothetical protein